MAINSPKNDFVEKHRFLTYADEVDTVYDGSKILDGSVTTDKIADYAVTTDKIDDDAVTTDKIADYTVTTDKIDDESITLSKMNTDVLNLLEGNVKGFDTVADMQSATLEAGDICHTNGFHAAGDGGAAFYKITASGTANGMDVLACGDVFANLVITESYVTPEMFGAYGDGVHDDTNAIQAAIDSEQNLICSNSHYVVSTLNISKNKVYDFNGAEIESTSNSVITVGNSAYLTTALSANHAESDEYYELASVENIESGDLLLITNQETWSPLRNYYKKGGILQVREILGQKVYVNGVLPFDMLSANSEVQAYKPCSFTLKNIKAGSDNSSAIFIDLNNSCSNCTVENVICQKNVYTGISVSGYNNMITKCNMSIREYGYNENCYGIVVMGSYNTVENCSIYCKWHSITTSGTFIAIGTIVSNCVFNNFTDHSSSCETIVDNSTIDNLLLSNSAIVKDSIIKTIELIPGGVNARVNFIVTNCNITNGDVKLDLHSQSGLSEDVHYDNIIIENCTCSNMSRADKLSRLIIFKDTYNNNLIDYDRITIKSCKGLYLASGSSALKPKIKYVRIDNVDNYNAISKNSTENIETLEFCNSSFDAIASEIFPFLGKNLIIRNVEFDSKYSSDSNLYIYEGVERVLIDNFVFKEKRVNLRISANITTCKMVSIHSSNFFLKEYLTAIPLIISGCIPEANGTLPPWTEYYNGHIYTRSFNGSAYSFTQLI